MNSENLAGQGKPATGNEHFGSAATPLKSHADELAAKVQSAYADAKDAVAGGVDAASSVDFAALRDEVAKLAKSVSDIVMKQASSAGAQVMDAVGAAGDNISQSTGAAQEKLVSLEADVGASIRKNPWSAVAIAALIGLLIGKMS